MASGFGAGSLLRRTATPLGSHASSSSSSSSSMRTLVLPRCHLATSSRCLSRHSGQRRWSSSTSTGSSSSQAAILTAQWRFAALALAAAGFGLASLSPPRPLHTEAASNAAEPKIPNSKPYGALDPSQADFDRALEQLRSHFASSKADGNVSTDSTDLESKGFSSWCQHDASLPAVVVFPESTDDVVAVVNIARNNGIPLVPFAGGTSLEAHWYAPKDARTGKTLPCISLAFERMDSIVEHDEANGYVRVQPGLGWQDLNEELKQRGSEMFWPVDPGPGSCFGGMLATGGSGTGAVRYGTMKGDLVLNVTVVLPSGEVIKTRSDARKSSAGPDLTKLFLGSEGTLGVITEVTLRLVPRLPESVVTVAFNTVDDACRAVGEVINHGVGISSIELLDDVMIQAINFASKPKVPHPERPSLFIKFSGSEAHTTEDQRLTREIVARHGADMGSLRLSKDAAEVEELWESRKVALWSAMQYRGEGARCWTTDVCVPIAKLPELVKRVQQDLKDSGAYGPIVGHSGDGNFHSLIVYKTPEEFRVAEGVVHRMVHLAQDLGGTCTGEHGIGRGKREYLERELGKGTVDLLRLIKRTMDPTGFMNPGCLLLPEDDSAPVH